MKRKSRSKGKSPRKHMRAARSRLGARCSFCDGRFKNKQAVRAHLKACELYLLQKRLRQEPKATPSASGTLPKAADTQQCDRHATAAGLGQTDSADLRRPRRPGRESHDNLLCLLDTDEHFATVLSVCLGHCRIVKLMSSVRSAEQAHYHEWGRLYLELQQCARDCHQMVLHSRLDPNLLYEMYRRVLEVKGTWLRYRRQDLFPMESEGQTRKDESHSEYELHLQQEESLFNTIVSALKRMYVASR